MADMVTLSIPRNPQYYRVAALVVGGLAAGLSLPYDALDDLQLAIGSLLDHDELESTGDVTLRLSVTEDALQASLGSFVPAAIERVLRDGADDQASLDLRRVLDTIVDSVTVDVSGEGEQWVTLTKSVRAAAV